jgi:hypothetical protein
LDPTPANSDRLERKRANEGKISCARVCRVWRVCLPRARVSVCRVWRVCVALFLTEGAAPKIPVALFPDLGESEGETRSGISRRSPLVTNSYLREELRPRDLDRLERKRANEGKIRACVCVECGVSV